MRKKLKEFLEITDNDTLITLGVGDMMHENIKKEKTPAWLMGAEIESISLYDDGWKSVLGDDFPTNHSIFINLKV